MAKWLWKQCWDFSALDSPAKYRSVSRRVVKFAIPRYLFGAITTPTERLWGKLIVFIISSTGSRSGFGGCGMHNGCDFWD